MLNRHTLIRVMACAVILHPSHAPAFEISPWSFAASDERADENAKAREKLRSHQDNPWCWDKPILDAIGRAFRQPVHEELTLRALALLQPNATSSCDWQSQALTDEGQDLIDGVRWNDSPYVERTGWAFFYCWGSGSRLGKNPLCWGQQFVYGSTHPGEPDPQHTTFIARSHFYDLQFLHAMAPEGQSPHDTIARILMWGEFVALIHSGRVIESTRIEEVGPLMTPDGQKQWNLVFPPHPEWRDNINSAKWQVGGIFLPPGPERGVRLRNYALGSFLHIVQDSYAPGHVARKLLPDTGLPWGTISEFHSYNGQDKDWHSCHDQNPVRTHWKAYVDAAEGPIGIGAKLIRRFRGISVETSTPQELVVLRSDLTSAFLKLTENPRNSSPGDGRPTCDDKAPQHRTGATGPSN